MNEEIKQTTKKIIAEMLTESTGKHMMDSGDAYGRHWEENQKQGIKKGKQPVYDYINDSEQRCTITPIVPIFDYLSETVEYTEECQMLEELLPCLHLQVLDYIEDIANHPSKYEKKLQVFERNELFGSQVENTYNSDNVLSQDFQYVWFEYDGEDYIGISIHNGCDIRGGYTDIHIFKVQWAEEMCLAKFEANISCKCGMHNYRQLDPNYIEYNGNNCYDKINEKFIYVHSYIDADHNLRCKYCNEIIGSEMISI